MSAIPQLVQRFRARELAKAAGHLKPKQKTPIKLQNPFLPFFNPATKRWAPPLYSRRRQAELIKAAKASNTLHLLPSGPKLGPNALERYQKTKTAQAEASSSNSAGPSLLETAVSTHAATGLTDVRVRWMGEIKEKAVPGADVGARLYAGKKRMFKGHKWERELKKRKAKVGVRLRDMPKRIERFKSVSLERNFQWIPTDELRLLQHYRRRRPSPLLPSARRKETLPF